MKYTKKDLDEKNKAQYEVTVDSETVAKNHAKALRHLGKDAKISGFRKGHIPMEVLERSINPAKLADEEINSSINDAIIELIEKEDLQLLDQPTIEVSKYVPGQVLEFKATIEVVPPVKLADIKKLTAKLEKVKVDKKEIDEVVERLRTSAAEKKEVDRAAKDGDEVVIDFTGLKDGEEFAGGKAKDYDLKLGSGSFIPGFEEGIIGHKAGDKFDIDVTFPKEYGAKELAGKKAVFKIDLKKEHELVLPKLDDDFAKSIAPDFKTMDDLRSDIERELTAQEKSSAKQKYQDALLEELGEKSNVEVPEVLVNDQMPQLEKQFEQNLMYRGLTLDGYLKQEKKTKEQWTKEELCPTAEKRVRSSMVLTQLAKDEKITVTPEEVKRYQDKILARYGSDSMKKQFETPEALRQIRQQVITEKTLAKLVELAQK